MPSFLIVGYLEEILRRWGLFAPSPPPPTIRENSQKDSSSIALRFSFYLLRNMNCECEHNYATENVHKTVRECHQNCKNFLRSLMRKSFFTEACKKFNYPRVAIIAHTDTCEQLTIGLVQVYLKVDCRT